jgi:16S rRNA (guanine527-N7)-methyltransferase
MRGWSRCAADTPTSLLVMRDDEGCEAAVGQGVDGVSAGQRQQLGALLRVLEADEHAPTAIRRREDAATRHLGDSLIALELEPVRAARRIADLGSGAGFPGAALAVALPGARVSLVESQRRRCDFLERLCAAAQLENVDVICARAEAWSEGRGRHDLAVARALAPQIVVLEYAAPLLQVGGSLVDWRGRRSGVEEEATARAAGELGLRLIEIRRVVPFEGANDRHLHLFAKVRETPDRFPRRSGMARKRPLGG